ncbi:MAG: hypothetical protein GZ088_04305 [Acidipila sp.]|nr:hypothetical protein [Acidipila sp.]
MKGKACAALIWLLILAVPIRPQENGPASEPSVLALPLFPASLERTGIPLTRALGEVGSYVRNGYALFGLEVRSSDGQEPIVSLNLQPGNSLGDALRQIMDQVPGYKFKVVSAHMINIYPVLAENDPQDVLKTLVPEFNAVNVDPGQILTRPEHFIPELAARLTPKRTGPPQPSGVVGSVLEGVNPRVITLHLKNVTVQEILNAVSEAMEQFPPEDPPVGWIYTCQPDSNSPIGGKHSWSFLFCAPRTWKEAASGPG